MPVILAAATTPASASSDIVWRNKATGGCLRLYNDGGIDTDAQALVHCLAPGKAVSVRWDDSQSNLANNNGAWKITARNTYYYGYCLASWYAGSNGLGNVYIEPCDSPANYYQQWYEKWTGDGMQLINRQTGLCLDSDSDGNVYTNRCNSSNWQVWQ
ncbi:ricin-type beta-trefoil lectin domain protein [Streptomyces sp. NPDC057540]|uniref:RICIN domain-containing protein n=1 Tax=Streptomyces sp. NPDC057540 TaxID=3346160 RepID=UPI0036BD82CD